jgi:hypothetical protein
LCRYSEHEAIPFWRLGPFAREFPDPSHSIRPMAANGVRVSAAAASE